NSGGASGTAWSAVTLNTGDIEYDTAQFSGGASSLLVQPLSSVVSEVRRTFDAPSTQAQVSFYFRTPSAFTVSSTICQLRNATAAAVSIQFTTSSKLRVMNAAGSQVPLTT